MDGERKKSPKPRTWDEKFADLQGYKAKHGDCNVPFRYKEDYCLGKWVHAQRRNFSLSSEQRKRLDALGFEWETLEHKQQRIWNQNFARLSQFKEIYGHCRIPAKNPADEDLVPWSKELGTWVSFQRQNYKKGTLSKAREAKLNSIDFEWVLSASSRGITEKQDMKWMEMYTHLSNFKKKNGHCLVPYLYPDNDLGVWVSKQRVAHEANTMPSYRKELLDAIGFVWSVDITSSLKQQAWDQSFIRLIEFMEEHGHCKVRPSYSKHGLGSWFQWQKKRFGDGKLHPHRAKLLSALGISWGESVQERWNDNYQELKLHKEKAGNCVISPSSSLGLHAFARNQRMLYQEGKLDPKRKIMLDRIGFEWTAGGREEAGPREGPKEAAASKSLQQVADLGAVSTDQDIDRVLCDTDDSDNEAIRRTRRKRVYRMPRTDDDASLIDDRSEIIVEEQRAERVASRRKMDAVARPTVGTRIRKHFLSGCFEGKVVSQDHSYSHVVYAGGYEEDLADEEVEKYMRSCSKHKRKRLKQIHG